MKLTDLKCLTNETEIVNDGEFESLGLVVSKTNNMLLCFVEKEEYLLSLPSNVTCLICPKELVNKIPKTYGILCSNNPRITFFKIHNYLFEFYDKYYNKSADTIIGKECRISEKASICDKEVIIGNNVIIEDNVVIRDNVTIGNNTIIRAGSIIGGNGFEFKRCSDDTILQVEHCGGVKIGDNVEIQYNTCIDRAVYPWDNTIIDDYSKIDNLVHVGHAGKIGKRCLLAANSLIGGRTVIGDDCWIGISATLRNGLTIGNKANVNMGAVVTKNVAEGQSVTGNFAIEHSRFIDFIKSIK